MRSLETSLLEGLLPGREDDERDAIVEASVDGVSSRQRQHAVRSPF